MTRTNKQKNLRKLKRVLATRERKGCDHPKKNALTEEEAVAAALRSTRRSGLRIGFYSDCPCGWFHLTRKKAKIRA